MIAATPEDLRLRAEGWAATLGRRTDIALGHSAVGGGSLPEETQPTWLLTLETDAVPGGATGVAQRLRSGDPPVIARVQDDLVLFDPRTVAPEEEGPLLSAIRAAIDGGGLTT